MAERKKSAFDERITSERAILRDYLKSGNDLPTFVGQVGQPTIPNPVSEEKVGTYRSPDARKAATADMEVITEFIRLSKPVPSFLEAGPRRLFFHDPQSVRAAIVTSGGLAPGLNSVVHSIVSRHWNTYSINEARRGGVFGIYDSFVGLYNRPLDMIILNPGITEHWLERGGSMLGARRFSEKKIEELADRITENLELNDINILYVIGGDGSLTVAHEIAKRVQGISVVGIPKTMDNDVLWVWQSFGFNTAVAKATEVVNTMHWEAESTRRVCIIELFGAESGFVAANAALASGHADLVLVPESFLPLSPQQYEQLLGAYVEYVSRTVRDKERAHAVIVLAEGVAELLKQRGVTLGGTPVTDRDFAAQLRDFLQGKLKDRLGRVVDVFVNQPRHNIRAVPANAYDQIYCERLGALAVDNALAGYTDFMISQWLTEYVLVPLELMTLGQKSIPPGGMFWKQVVSSTGQPSISTSSPA
jgi:6-phosphofructokinase 1